MHHAELRRAQTGHSRVAAQPECENGAKDTDNPLVTCVRPCGGETGKEYTQSADKIPIASGNTGDEAYTGVHDRTW